MTVMRVHLKQETNPLNKQESMGLCKGLSSTRCKKRIVQQHSTTPKTLNGG